MSADDQQSTRASGAEYNRVVRRGLALHGRSRARNHCAEEVTTTCRHAVDSSRRRLPNPGVRHVHARSANKVRAGVGTLNIIAVTPIGRTIPARQPILVSRGPTLDDGFDPVTTWVN